MKVLRFFINYWQQIDPKKAGRLKLMLWVILFASLLAGALNAVLLGYTNKLLNQGASGQTALYTFIALCVLMPLARFTAEALLNIFLLKVVTDLQLNFCRQVLLAPLRLIEERGRHTFAAVMSKDIKHIGEALLAIVMIFMHLAIILGCLGYMGWLSWKALGLTLIFMIVGFVTQEITAGMGAGFFGKARKEFEKLNHHLVALTEGNKELKLHRERREAFYNNHYAPTAAGYRTFQFQGQKWFTAAGAYISVLYFVLVGLLLFGVARWLNLDRETLTGFTLCLLFILEPLIMLVVRLQTVAQAGVYVDNVQKLGLQLADAGPDANLSGESSEALPEWQSLEFKDMVYSYSEEERKRYNRFQLGPINLSLKKGEFVIIAGGNGSGKTTLAKLLSGLYAPSDGELRYNDILITNENRDAYRQIFSAVYVDTHLFENLLGLDQDNLNQTARDYIKKLEIDSVVDVDQGQLSTTQLSQGQRKRLALLTAYLEDRPFYVFDEWTANQDPQFRELFYEQIIPDLLERGKTVVVITHDDSYFHKADRFVKLDYGRIDEDANATEIRPLAARD